MSQAIIRSAGMVIYSKRNHDIEYLLLHYPGGYWSLAKGKMESGETKHMTARREVKEETGLEPELKDGFQETIIYMFKDRHGNKIRKEVYFFIGKSESQDVVLSHEHQGYIWLGFDEALKKITHQNTKEVLAKADHVIKEYIEK